MPPETNCTLRKLCLLFCLPSTRNNPHTWRNDSLKSNYETKTTEPLLCARVNMFVTLRAYLLFVCLFVWRPCGDIEGRGIDRLSSSLVCRTSNKSKGGKVHPASNGFNSAGDSFLALEMAELLFRASKQGLLKKKTWKVNSPFWRFFLKTVNSSLTHQTNIQYINRWCWCSITWGCGGLKEAADSFIGYKRHTNTSQAAKSAVTSCAL